LTEERFRLGLIGAGRMGRTHLRAIAPSHLVAVTAVVEPVETAREAAAGHGRRTFATVEEMVDAGGIDGVLIAAPSDLHAQIVERVAAARLPILCEKPCGLTPADVARAARAAEAHDVPLQVAYWRRFVPGLQKLQRRIASRELGDVHFVACSQWDGAPPAAPFRAHSGGIFIDMGVHEFDQLRWLTGQDIGNLSAIASPLVADQDVLSDVDSGQALLAMSGGATGLVSLGRWFPLGDMARVEAFGTHDAVRIDFLDPAEGEVVQLDALRRQAEAFADYARGGRPTGASVEDAARALEAAFEATGQVPRLAEAAAAPAGTLGGHA
jgi:myo-inositol 2-dehydrogenase / D-chiro-inositol 1-dehydrogenase